MLRRTYFFDAYVVNKCLYVAGRECEGHPYSLRSTEMYDPNRNRWTFISEMTTSMGVLYKGKWF